MNDPRTSRIEAIRKRLESGFLGFWVRQYRMSYLIVITLVILGLMATMMIPKESNPAVNLGMVSVSTVYPGANPIDIDALITDKMYKAIKDIKGIDSITSSSSLGMSSLMLTLKTSANSKDVVNDVRNAIARVALPTDAKNPSVTEIQTDTNMVFSVYLYAKDPNVSKALLYDRAFLLKEALEGVSGVNTVSLSAGGDGMVSGGGNDAIYDVEVIIPEEKLQSLGLSLASIGSIIASYNRDQPIGNYSIGEKKYDFRIEGKNRTSFEFLSLPIPLPQGGTVLLGDLTTIQRTYKSDAKNLIQLSGTEGELGGLPFVTMTVNKSDSASIFQASNGAKLKIDSEFERQEYANFGFVYGTDLADMIRDDYKELFREALITLTLVFSAMYVFVGFRDSLFATLTLPLAFLATFIILYAGGYSMNFLTNFSLILSFGIAIDTIIVIVQAASAKIRVGYDPRSAIMLALREYAVPIIAGVMTTIVVFIPMMFLPGILGKFLAYIPITIFGVLATGLVLAITVNSALYLLFVKRKTTYVHDEDTLEYATDEEKELLALEREGKTLLPETTTPLRLRVIHKVTLWYKGVLRNFLEHVFLRRLAIFVPVVLLVLSFIFLAPRVGFELFPGDDNAVATITIAGPVGQKTEVTTRDTEDIAKVFAGYPEIDYTTIVVQGNKATVTVQLTKRSVRKKLGERSVFELEPLFLEGLQKYSMLGYNVTSAIAEGGPPGGKPVGLKLIADDPSQLDELIRVAKDFESELKTIPGTKNVGRSSSDTPGQFVFTLKHEQMADVGISANQLFSVISQSLNGYTLGSIEDNGEDMNIVLKSSQFTGEVRVENILSLPVTVGQTVYRIGDFVDVKLTNATALISREKGDIQITVDADLEKGVDTVSTQNKYLEYADSYDFPSGISYKLGGENEENSELIVAVLTSFFLAVIAIFAILTLQFNSFSQPAVILYSVIMSLPFVMIGLLLTNNQFSLPFGIGFIAFTGIAVNHGIILISAINENLKKGVDGITALVQAGSSRLEPMLLTTVTTALGILPIALRDRFWSGMGFTIIFGVISATLLTLFIVKGIYYELYLKPKNPSRILKIFSWIRSRIRFRKRKSS